MNLLKVAEVTRKVLVLLNKDLSNHEDNISFGMRIMVGKTQFELGHQLLVTFACKFWRFVCGKLHRRRE